jgi:hypothetical protein
LAAALAVALAVVGAGVARPQEAALPRAAPMGAGMQGEGEVVVEQGEQPAGAGRQAGAGPALPVARPQAGAGPAGSMLLAGRRAGAGPPVAAGAGAARRAAAGPLGEWPLPPGAAWAASRAG